MNDQSKTGSWKIRLLRPLAAVAICLCGVTRSGHSDPQLNIQAGYEGYIAVGMPAELAVAFDAPGEEQNWNYFYRARTGAHTFQNVDAESSARAVWTPSKPGYYDFSVRLQHKTDNRVIDLDSSRSITAVSVKIPLKYMSLEAGQISRINWSVRPSRKLPPVTFISLAPTIARVYRKKGIYVVHGLNQGSTVVKAVIGDLVLSQFYVTVLSPSIPGVTNQVWLAP